MTTVVREVRHWNNAGVTVVRVFETEGRARAYIDGCRAMDPNATISLTKITTEELEA